MKLNELKTSTVQHYLDKVVDPVYGMPKSNEKLSQRTKGIERASQRVAGKKPTSEEQNSEPRSHEELIQRKRELNRARDERVRAALEKWHEEHKDKLVPGMFGRNARVMWK